MNISIDQVHRRYIIEVKVQIMIFSNTPVLIVFFRILLLQHLLYLQRHLVYNDIQWFSFELIREWVKKNTIESVIMIIPCWTPPPSFFFATFFFINWVIQVRLETHFGYV